MPRAPWGAIDKRPALRPKEDIAKLKLSRIELALRVANTIMLAVVLPLLYLLYSSRPAILGDWEKGTDYRQRVPFVSLDEGELPIRVCIARGVPVSLLAPGGWTC